LDKTGTN